MDHKEIDGTLRTAAMMMREGGNLVMAASIIEIADQLEQTATQTGPDHNTFDYYIAFTFMVPGSNAISGGSRQFSMSAPLNSNEAINFVIHKIIAPQILADLHLLDSSRLGIVITNVIPLGSKYVSPLLKP